MASGAFEFPGPWLVEDTWLSSSFGPGRDHLGSVPQGQLLQHCGHPVGTLRKGGYVTPAMGCEPLSPRPAAGLCKQRRRLAPGWRTWRGHTSQKTETRESSCWPWYLADHGHPQPSPHQPPGFFKCRILAPDPE